MFESVEAHSAAVMGSVVTARPHARVALVILVQSHVCGKSRYRSKTEPNANQTISGQSKAQPLVAFWPRALVRQFPGVDVLVMPQVVIVLSNELASGPIARVDALVSEILVLVEHLLYVEQSLAAGMVALELFTLVTPHVVLTAGEPPEADKPVNDQSVTAIKEFTYLLWHPGHVHL